MAILESKRKALGLALPPPMPTPPGVVLPFPWARVVGRRALIWGHGPRNSDGSLAGPFGKVGRDLRPRSRPTV